MKWHSEPPPAAGGGGAMPYLHDIKGGGGVFRFTFVVGIGFHGTPTVHFANSFVLVANHAAVFGVRATERGNNAVLGRIKLVLFAVRVRRAWVHSRIPGGRTDTPDIFGPSLWALLLVVRGHVVGHNEKGVGLLCRDDKIHRVKHPRQVLRAFWG